MDVYRFACIMIRYILPTVYPATVKGIESPRLKWNGSRFGAQHIGSRTSLLLLPRHIMPKRRWCTCSIASTV